MIIEGKNVVFEAINSGMTINKLYVQSKLYDDFSNKIIALAKEKSVRINFCDKIVLDKKSVLKKHQGFIAEVVDFDYCNVDDIFNSAHKKGELPFIVILDGLEDPHNFGAIIRSCECAGVHGIIVPKHRSVLVNETVIKTSVGAIANIKIARVINLNNTIAELKKQGVWVYALEAGGDDIYKTNLKGPLAIVVGGEGNGVSQLTKQKCDAVISLPLEGRVNSLNASVACGVALYEALRQRK